MKPKTIQIFLPDGSPRSIRIAEITSRIVKVIVIPRNKLEEAAKRKELHHVGIYFLFGEKDEDAKDSVYIGEAEDCYKRLKQHNKGKDFWNTAMVVVSKTDSLTKAHVKFLEHFLYRRALETNRYHVENEVVPTASFITEQMEADLMDTFETVKALMGTLGFPIFEELDKPDNTATLTCRGKDANASGEYSDEGFVVYEGSIANIELTRTAGNWITNIREKLIQSGILIEQEGILVFTSDYIFKSPSAAAGAILGRRANGWTEWKDASGKTLDEIIRKEY